MNHQNKCDDCPQGLVAALMRNPSKALFSKDTESHWLGENETDPPHCALVLLDPSLKVLKFGCYSHQIP